MHVKRVRDNHKGQKNTATLAPEAIRLKSSLGCKEEGGGWKKKLKQKRREKVV